MMVVKEDDEEVGTAEDDEEVGTAEDDIPVKSSNEEMWQDIEVLLT